ncbi:energy-coupling factor transporter ATP-binding protein EcfA2 [Nocardia transvalensis]|uniref:Energy-coupling factor transporter ATP-binding protein EcfA2 n=1 Tax=Nocardia transvalensis TaxID=37333 RepID=A0A7W9UKZ7_9NOCA|nr:NACHT domain-containing protein [Nocardia transvalensis]MBB5916847.1 energy-coupling factor transporter ATP-binding protein EcfA2 [Nocardia transvalensis]
MVQSEEQDRSHWSRIGVWIFRGFGLSGMLLALLKSFGSDHPLLAAFVIVVLFSALWFFSYVVRPFRVWLARIGEATEVAVRELLFGAGRRYRQNLRVLLDELDQRGFETREPEAPSAHRAFVEATLVAADPGSVGAHLLSDPTAVGRKSIDYFIADRGRRNPGRLLVVLGVPGVGKTTLLRHMAREWSNKTVLARVRQDIPILITLRECSPRVFDDPNRDISIVSSEVTELDVEWLKIKLRRGRCRILLDGVDEIVDVEERQKIFRWITVQRRRYRHNDFMVTCRPGEYDKNILEPTLVIRLCHFSSAQIEKFVLQWYDAVRLVESEATPNYLINQLNGNETLRSLAANPLLLTFIVIVFRHATRGRGHVETSFQLPQSRAHLYHDICVHMLSGRPLAKGLSVLEGQMEVLQFVAFTMMEMQVTEITRKDALSLLAKSNSPLSADCSPEDLLMRANHDGLLSAPVGSRIGRDSVSFTHRTFQEYLAARHVYENGMHARLRKRVMDSTGWWRETCLFYAALGDAGNVTADQIVVACLERRDSAFAIDLALSICDQGDHVSGNLRREVDGIIESAATSPPDIRRVVARALLLRHFRHAPILDNGNRCSSPITWNIYELFCQDVNLVSEFTSDFIDRVDRSSIVMGISGEAAVAFVAWSNSLMASGSGATCRLPSHRDVTLVKQGYSNVWIESAGELLPARWSANGNTIEYPYLVAVDDYNSSFGTANAFVAGKIGREIESLDSVVKSVPNNSFDHYYSSIVDLALDRALGAHIPEVSSVPYGGLRLPAVNLRELGRIAKDLVPDLALAIAISEDPEVWRRSGIPFEESNAPEGQSDYDVERREITLRLHVKIADLIPSMYGVVDSARAFLEDGSSILDILDGLHETASRCGIDTNAAVAGRIRILMLYLAAKAGNRGALDVATLCHRAIIASILAERRRDEARDEVLILSLD